MTAKRQGMTAPLRGREFRLLFFGQLISNLGDWLDFLALMVLITFEWEYGSGALAALAVVIALPWIAVAPFAGVFADRWPRKATMVVCDLLRALIVFGLIFAPNLAVLITLVGLKTIVSTFFMPAQEAAIRMTVEEHELHSANALSHFVLQSTKVIGPALGGVLVGLFSPRTAFAADSVTFLLSALVIAQMKPLRAEADEEEEDEESLGYWTEMREGLTHIRRSHALVTAIVSLSAAVFLLISFDTLSPLALGGLGATRAEFGFALAAVGLGGVAGAVLVGRYGNDVNPFVMMGTAKVLIGGLVAVMGFALLAETSAPALIWAPVLFVIGVASSGVLISAPTIVQRETPPELMGRVFTTSQAIPTAFQVAAPIVGAAVAEWQSVGFVYVASGLGLAALGLVVVLIRPPVKPFAGDEVEEPTVPEDALDLLNVGEISTPVEP